MEKFLVDREDAIAAVRRAIDNFISDNEAPTGVDMVLKLIEGPIINEIKKIDPQKIEGIDFTYGDRISQEVVERCQLHRDNRAIEEEQFRENYNPNDWGYY